MREVMKWSKNYITNEITQKKVTKNSDNLIGRATIKVLGKDGNLKQEVVSENIIHPGFSTFDWYHRSFRDLVGGWNTESAKDRVPFYKIMLSTDESEEGENNIAINGNNIGYAHMNDTSGGTDLLKGTYDAINSFSERTDDGFIHRHCVFEFGNAKANGTFNSVLFTYKNMYSSTTNTGVTPPFRIRQLPSIKGLLGGSTAQTVYNSSENKLIPTERKYLYKGVDKKFYVNTSEGYCEVVNLEKWLNGIEAFKSDLNANENYVPYCYSINDNKYIKLENTVVTGHKQGFSTTFNLNIYDVDTHVISETVPMNITTDVIPDLQKYIDSNSSTSSSYNVKAYVEKYFVNSNGDVTVAIRLNTGGSSYSIFPYYTHSMYVKNAKLDLTSTSYEALLCGTYSTKLKKWIKKPI